jgi:2,3-bisphosphoglycerate-dependent phosphoglycerate mutase
MSSEGLEASVWLIRHAQSHANAGQATDSPKTIGLSELGLDQAKELAVRIPQCPDRIVVSPFDRTLATARPLIAKLAESGLNVPVVEWPIQEFTYLNPLKCRGTTAAQRQGWAAEYWLRADPNWEDGDGAESFCQLLQRVSDFSAQLSRQAGTSLVFGHGMFFKAFVIGLDTRLTATAESMTRYRRLESLNPIHNTQIIKLQRAADASWRAVGY